MMRRNKNCVKFEHFGLPRQRHLSPPVLRWRCKRQLSTVAGRNERKRPLIGNAESVQT